MCVSLPGEKQPTLLQPFAEGKTEFCCREAATTSGPLIPMTGAKSGAAAVLLQVGFDPDAPHKRLQPGSCDTGTISVLPPVVSTIVPRSGLHFEAASGS